MAPPRSPFIKERKIRKKLRDDDIKGILESVIARVSETDLLRATEKKNHTVLETSGETVDLNQNISENIYAQIKQPDQKQTKENTSIIIKDEYECCQQENEKEVDITIVFNNNQHELMESHNARRDELWNQVRNASNLSLHKVANNNK